MNSSSLTSLSSSLSASLIISMSSSSDIPDDAHELLLAHLIVFILVGFLDHLHELLVRHSLPELLGNRSQVLEGDLPCRTLEELEGLLDLLLGILLAHFRGHDLEELVEVQQPLPRGAAALVEVGDQLFKLLLLWLEPQGPQRDLQILRIDGACAICDEEVECLLLWLE